MLLSVPYALKAADADTVGGKPLSAFVLTGDKSGVARTPHLRGQAVLVPG